MACETDTFSILLCPEDMAPVGVWLEPVIGADWTGTLVNNPVLTEMIALFTLALLIKAIKHWVFGVSDDGSDVGWGDLGDD